MLDRQLILARIAYLQAELGALAALVRLDDVSFGAAQATVAAAVQPAAAEPAQVATAPAVPTKPAKRAKAPARWSYVPHAAYRLQGPNPFRDGNNYALYDHLVAKFDGAPFSRRQLGAEIDALKQAGTFKSSQPEHQLVVGFVSFAGGKGRLEMAEPGSEAPVEEAAPVVEAPTPVVAEGGASGAKRGRKPKPAGEAASAAASSKGGVKRRSKSEG